MDSNPNDNINPNAPLIIIDGVPRDNLAGLTRMILKVYQY